MTPNSLENVLGKRQCIVLLEEIRYLFLGLFRKVCLHDALVLDGLEAAVN